jgi:HEPN domain-containing protein
MNSDKIDIEKTINHWISRSEQDFETMIHLYSSKDYHWALFIGHLVIERLLKALVIKRTKSHPPFTHDLRRLSKLSGIDLNDKQKRDLDTITTFNLNARYDDYKLDFYKKCTSEFSQKWISNIKTLREWIKERL